MALGLAIASACFAWQWPITIVATVLFLVSAIALLVLAFRPPIEIHPEHLRIGFREIPWTSIRRVDRTGWVAPLAVHLELENKQQIFLVYPCDLESGSVLLRQLRKHSIEALLDGVPHYQVWRDTHVGKRQPLQLPSPKYQLLSDAEEAEVERMFQQLKSAGRIDSQPSPDDK